MNINDTQKKIIDGVLKKYDALLDELYGVNPSYISDKVFVEIWRGRKDLENDMYSTIQQYNSDNKYPLAPMGGWNTPTKKSS
tara:strand:- start:608 stop:853 length:246 start_codon:yes stop_codon:yes gene_type:complete